jgi:4-amino-4-deoxy-L-arabinose transferase-like glycosyltransferase
MQTTTTTQDDPRTATLPQPLGPRAAPRWIHLGVALLTVASLALHLWGIRKELPYIPHIDEPTLVRPAVQMAATGDMNPHWFGHPGSTVIYPLVPVYRAYHALARGGALLRPDPALAEDFTADPAPYYLLGRVLTILYAAGCVPLVYLIGRRALSPGAGLLGAGLAIAFPIAVSHGQLVRTDSASAFFGLAGLYACLALHDRPTLGRQVVAGLVAGLAISTKYYLGILVFLILAVDAVRVAERLRRGVFREQDVWVMVAGLAAVGIGFGLSTPYFILDADQAWHDITVETRSTHLGHDGLSTWGNLRWYLGTILPQEAGVARYALAGAGLLLIAWRRRAEGALVAVYLALYLLGISLSALHWERWLIPILPLVGLLAAHALWTAASWLAARRARLAPYGAAAAVVAALAVTYAPARAVAAQNVRQSHPTTRILLREWIMANVPTGECIAQEEYTAPLRRGEGYLLKYVWALPDESPDAYARLDCDHFVASSYMYSRYLAEPARYARHVAFYERLFREGTLLVEIEPSPTTDGPVLRMYRWSPG